MCFGVWLTPANIPLHFGLSLFNPVEHIRLPYIISKGGYLAFIRGMTAQSAARGCRLQSYKCCNLLNVLYLVIPIQTNLEVPMLELEGLKITKRRMAPPMDSLLMRLRGATAEMTPPVVGASKSLQFLDTQHTTQEWTKNISVRLSSGPYTIYLSCRRWYRRKKSN